MSGNNAAAEPPKLTAGPPPRTKVPTYVWSLGVLGAAVTFALAPRATVAASLGFTFFAFFATFHLIPALREMFLAAGLGGVDMSKDDKYKVAESAGVVCGAVYMISLFVFMPLPFLPWFLKTEEIASDFPHHKFVEFLAALLSICCMIFLGFADDVLNLRWRHKLLLPSIATLPLLMVYYVSFGVTFVLLPPPIRFLFGKTVDLGVFYYIFLGMLAVFCTNSINILAGVNGVEAGQSLIIALSIAINNLIQMNGTCCVEEHTLSFYLMLPFIGTNVALLIHNWYPSRVFVGDTFCYFAGMTFAVSGILGHYSKTMLLFFVPQVFNFVYSLPQLFRIVPCPRHRLPSYDRTTKKMNMSYFVLDEASTIGKHLIKLMAMFRLVDITKGTDGKYRANNLTILNFLLLKFGPQREDRLTIMVMVTQVVCSVIAFVIRYPLSSSLYS